MATKKRRQSNAVDRAVDDAIVQNGGNEPERGLPLPFRIALTAVAQTHIDLAVRNDERKHRKILKTLGLLSQNPRYPGLNSHKMETQKSPDGGDVWESYVENNTPGAYRVFWFYGPDSGVITVFAITPHP